MNCEREVHIYRGHIKVYELTKEGIAVKIFDNKQGQIQKQVKTNAKNRAVIQYEMTTMNELARYPSIHAASKSTAVCESNIGACCREEYKHAGGFIWRYADV